MEDIDIISECETLEILDISNNLIESISPILSLRFLQYIDLSSNRISRLGMIICAIFSFTLKFNFGIGWIDAIVGFAYYLEKINEQFYILQIGILDR